ncbi:OVARIAN TUMOR DOMAIN-containing deubiquitinating enzyme 3-like [Carex rostrata]
MGAILKQLSDATAQFHLLQPPISPFSTALPLFARITSFLPESGTESAEMKKVEHYSVQRVTGDGRCMFRALIKGMARNKDMLLFYQLLVRRMIILISGKYLRGETSYCNLSFCNETGLSSLILKKKKKICFWVHFTLLLFIFVFGWGKIDDLRLAVKEVICDSSSERQNYEEALLAITIDEPLRGYCQRIRRPDFWGGESELLVLSRLCRQPIIVYIPEHEHSLRGTGNGFIPIAEYGLEFCKSTKQWKKRVPVRLLYSGLNHYDLLA